jgi:hypothetical protein
MVEPTDYVDLIENEIQPDRKGFARELLERH